GVEPHVARPLWRLYVLDDAILVRRVLMNYGERAVRIGGKRVARGRIETSADRDRGHHLARLIVGYRHHAAAASAEQAVVGGVDSHGDRLLARGGGPPPRHTRCLRVDLNHL